MRPHSSLFMRWLLRWLCLAALTGAGQAHADPAGRVGRIADVQGQVWLYDPNTGEWTDAVVNRPLSTADRLATDPQARAEVRIGSTTLRLDAGTELEVSQLDDERMAFVLHAGSVAARLRNAESARQFELNTAEGRFAPQRAGSYRFDREGDASHGSVASGQLVFEGVGLQQVLYAGQRGEYWIEGGNEVQSRLGQPEDDEFSRDVARRDAAETRSASTRYVSPEMTGAEDLDRHGHWESGSEYGALWIPRDVPPGWAPYQAGHWVWMRPWGWTWVDDTRWGFAPFHYGRWVHHRHRWCWAPGTYVARPVYAPALVAWVGGPGLSVSVNLGRAPTVGWFPLAPREVYVPGYRVSPHYVRQVNVTHVTRIDNVNVIVNHPERAWQQTHFRNRHHPKAVTVVSRDVFEARKPIAPSVLPWRGDPPHGRGRDHRAGSPPGLHALPRPPVEAPAMRVGDRGPGQPLAPPQGWRPKEGGLRGPMRSDRFDRPERVDRPATPMVMPQAPSMSTERVRRHDEPRLPRSAPSVQPPVLVPAPATPARPAPPVGLRPAPSQQPGVVVPIERRRDPDRQTRRPPDDARGFHQRPVQPVQPPQIQQPLPRPVPDPRVMRPQAPPPQPVQPMPRSEPPTMQRAHPPVPPPQRFERPQPPNSAQQHRQRDRQDDRRESR